MCFSLCLCKWSRYKKKTPTEGLERASTRMCSLCIYDGQLRYYSMSQVWKIKLYCIPGEHYSNLTHFHCLFLNVDVSKKKKKIAAISNSCENKNMMSGI